MQALSGSVLVRLWEEGMAKGQLERAILILQAAHVSDVPGDLCHLTIGERDKWLLKIMVATFGPGQNGYVQCPKCQEELEIELNLEDMQIEGEGKNTQCPYRFSTEGWSCSFRLPTSHDVEKAMDEAEQDHQTARNVLAKRCVLEYRQDGTAEPRDTLPESVVLALANHMSNLDPQADILLAINCASCQFVWQVPFDILSFLWAEIGSRAKALLWQVHVLARRYGWGEEDILTMSETRREAYMELITA